MSIFSPLCKLQALDLSYTGLRTYVGQLFRDGHGPNMLLNLSGNFLGLDMRDGGVYIDEGD